MIKIGDRVEYVRNIEWGPFVGEQGEVVHVFTDGAFLVRCDGGTGVYHTRRRDVCPIGG